jgi:cytochrome c biogenesis protein CcdA
MRFKEANERFISYKLYRRPAVVFNYDPETAIYNITEETLRAEIEYYIINSSNLDGGKIGIDSFQPGLVPSLTLPVVIISGLIDGINPCAFSLLIFFLSFLFNLKKRRLSVLSLGSIYIAGIFIGYLSLGLGILHTISILGIMHPFAVVSIFLLVVMGVLQIIEATTFGVRLLKFPSLAVPTFKRLTEKVTTPAAFVLGLFVSLCEFPCSGGVYVGIVVLLASKAYLYDGLFYLVLYNLMFVVPLVLLLVLAGNVSILLEMDRLRVVNRRRMKLLSGLFLIVLATLTWYITFKIPHN